MKQLFAMGVLAALAIFINADASCTSCQGGNTYQRGYTYNQSNTNDQGRPMYLNPNRTQKPSYSNQGYPQPQGFTNYPTEEYSMNSQGRGPACPATDGGRPTMNDRYTTNSDRTVVASIRSQLSGYDNVYVTANDGNVVLRGTVNSQSEKDKVEQAVRSIDGVNNINNQITVTNR